MSATDLLVVGSTYSAGEDGWSTGLYRAGTSASAFPAAYVFGRNVRQSRELAALFLARSLLGPKVRRAGRRRGILGARATKVSPCLPLVDGGMRSGEVVTKGGYKFRVYGADEAEVMFWQSIAIEASDLYEEKLVKKKEKKSKAASSKAAFARLKVEKLAGAK